MLQYLKDLMLKESIIWKKLCIWDIFQLGNYILDILLKDQPFAIKYKNIKLSLGLIKKLIYITINVQIPQPTHLC